MDNIIWKEMPDFPGYFVSNTGLVRHNDVLYDFKTTYRRGKRFTARRGKYQKRVSVARAVAFTFFEKDLFDTSITVDHIDGNRFNNNLDNLQLMSWADNLHKGMVEGFYPTRKIIVIDKITGEKLEFVSGSEACKYIGHERHYIFNLKNKENDRYKFIVFPKRKWAFENDEDDYTHDIYYGSSGDKRKEAA